MKIFMTSLALLVSFYAFSNSLNYSTYYPESFIQTVTTMNSHDNELIKQIRDVLNKLHLKKEGASDELVDKCENGQTCYSKKILYYSEARKYLFGKFHLKKNDQGEYFIKDVYCNQIFNNQTPFINAIGPMLIPNHEVLNCEHTWPISRFSKLFSEDEQKSDLHHLFPTETVANGIRENYLFGEITLYVIQNLCRSSSFGINENLSIFEKNRFVFEPPEEHKGNVARALFYFAIKYNLQIAPEEEIHLKHWHVLDPVDNEELQRNQQIYEIQFNRNPFIDFPELVQLISDF